MPTTLEQIQYGFDRDSRRTWKRRTLTTNEDDHYSYDALSQVTVAARGNLNLNLTAISGRPASEQSWDYDPTGNWRGFDAAENGNPILDQHRVHDRGNRLTQIEDSPTAMVLDRAGRMRQAAPDAEGDWNGKLELTWDAWSRVTSVKSNGATVGEYQNDGLTRRTTREVSGVTWQSYHRDAWRPLEERKNAETTAAMSYLWGARHRDDLARRDRATSGTTLNEMRYVLMDYFNASAITDAAGVVKERYAYSAFGLRSILNPDYSVRSSSECAFEFGFQGQFLDMESGLMNYGYRSYAPYLGRWMCKDPIAERGGFNLYANVGNGPVNLVDYLGLEDEHLTNIQEKNREDHEIGQARKNKEKAISKKNKPKPRGQTQGERRAMRRAKEAARKASQDYLKGPKMKPLAGGAAGILTVLMAMEGNAHGGDDLLREIRWWESTDNASKPSCSLVSKLPDPNDPNCASCICEYECTQEATKSDHAQNLEPGDTRTTTKEEKVPCDQKCPPASNYEN
jgi:RHS repeat-associated protein